MKTLTYSLILSLSVPFSSMAQNVINWRNFDAHHVIQLHGGMENGYVLGLGYGYRLPLKRNVLVSADYSFPTGKQLFDDFKVRLGGQGEVVQWKNWSASLRVYAIFRRYENQFATLSDFGSEFSVVAGYARRRWQLMGEFGFDKAISTKIRNSEVMKGFYPEIKDGWYVPTGGYFFYGFQSSVTIGRSDVFVRAGKLASQDFEATLNFPLYLKVGLNYRFGLVDGK